MSDKEIKSYNFKTNNKKNFFNKDYINSINSNSKNIFSSFNNISNIMSKKIPNLKLSSESSFKRKSMNTASNIINIVNNLPKAKGKVKVKMNINKYNIKYYVTNENFKKIIENINLNKTEGNKIRLRLENTKHKKPFSADNKNINIDNNNNFYGTNYINKKNLYKYKKFLKINNINKNSEKILINRENTLNKSDIKTLNLHFNNIDIIGDLDSETEKTSSSNSSNNYKNDINVLKLNKYKKFTENFLSDNKISLKKKCNNRHNSFRTNFNDYNNIIPFNNGSLEFKSIYQTSDNLININNIKKNFVNKKDNSLYNSNKNENSIELDNNNINFDNEIKSIKNNNNDENDSNQSNEKVIVRILESFKEKKKIKSEYVSPKNINKLNTFEKKNSNLNIEQKINSLFKNDLNDKNNCCNENVSMNEKNNLNDNNNNNKLFDEGNNKKKFIPKRRSSMMDLNKLSLNLDKKFISFRRKREMNQQNEINNINSLKINSNQINKSKSKFLCKLFENKNNNNLIKNNNSALNYKFDLDEKNESKSFYTSTFSIHSENYLNKIEKDKFYKNFEENIQIKLNEIENRKNQINIKFISNFIDKNFDELDKKIKIKEKEYLIKEGIELNCKIDINFLIKITKKIKMYKKEKKYQNRFYFNIWNKNKKIFYEKINKLKLNSSLKYHILNKYFDIIEEIYYFCFNTKNRTSTEIRKNERRKTHYSTIKKNEKVFLSYSSKNVQKIFANKNNYKIKMLLIESQKHQNNQEFINDLIMKESYKNNSDLKLNNNIFINNVDKNESINNEFFFKNFFGVFGDSLPPKIKSNSNNYVNNFNINNIKNANIKTLNFNNLNIKNSQNKNSIKNAHTFFKKTLKKYIDKEKKKKRKLSIINHINLNNINNIETNDILKDNIIYKISNSPKKRLLFSESNNINLTKNSSKKTSLKPIDLFSASNKYITQIQTDKIKNDMLESLGDNLYKVIFFYIKENNYNKVNYLIKQNSEFINMNYRDNEGYTFLNTSLRYNCKKDLIEFLIKSGSNPNICDNKGNTPLHYALSHENFQVVNLLIKFGAEENIKNCYGLNPWQVIGINLETLK